MGVNQIDTHTIQYEPSDEKRWRERGPSLVPADLLTHRLNGIAGSFHFGEQVVAEHLRAQGWTVYAENWQRQRQSERSGWSKLCQYKPRVSPRLGSWHYARPPRMGEALRRRQQDQPDAVCPIACKAQHRLFTKYRRLVGRGQGWLAVA